MVIMMIGLAGTAYFFISGSFTGATSTAFKIAGVEGNKITIQNLGTEPISSIEVYNNGAITTIIDFNRILAGQVGDIEFIPNIFGRSKIVIKSPSLSVEGFVDVDSVAYISQSENEKINSNTNRCSVDLYVLENSKIKFFSAIPRIFIPIVPGDCDSGVSSYDDRFGASPVRIWAKNTDSSNYRFNAIIIDDTFFRENSIGNFDFSDPNKIVKNFDGSSISYTGDVKSNLEPTVTYGISPDSNYVSVLLSVKNVGASDISVRLRWNGDQDGPQTCHFQSGFQANCRPDPLQVDQGEKWMAEWRSGNQDVTGYITLNGEVEIYSIWDGIKVEETSSTIVSPGQTHSFTFYIVSDVKGSPGNEWQPVEDTYNQIS